ncbi:MAG: helix-turn-helix domain-containing protein [Opitutaceae bacterium]|jgi:excisionase family DNA binding protein
MSNWLRSWFSGRKASRSWYLELAAKEGLDPESVLSSLVDGISSLFVDKGVVVHMGKRLDSFERPLLTVKQVAEFLSVSEDTVRKYARERVLTSVDIPGGSIRFDSQTLLDELNNYRRDSKFSG